MTHSSCINGGPLCSLQEEEWWRGGHGGLDDKVLDSLNSTCLRDTKPLATVLCAPERGPGAEF